MAAMPKWFAAFKPGEVVWAKSKGFSWWPGVVLFL